MLKNFRSKKEIFMHEFQKLGLRHTGRNSSPQQASKKDAPVFFFLRRWVHKKPKGAYKCGCTHMPLLGEESEATLRALNNQE